MPIYDPLVATHIITDADRRPTLRALGLQSFKDIPEHVPTVRWTWVLSGIKKADRASSRKNTKSQDNLDEDLMEDVWLHAAFSERIDAGSKLMATKWKGKAGTSTKNIKEKESSARNDDSSSQS
jgi:DNA polymerase lambda